jgi:hypothetical protein
MLEYYPFKSEIAIIGVQYVNTTESRTVEDTKKVGPCSPKQEPTDFGLVKCGHPAMHYRPTATESISGKQMFRL